MGSRKEDRILTWINDDEDDGSIEIDGVFSLVWLRVFYVLLGIFCYSLLLL